MIKMTARDKINPDTANRFIALCRVTAMAIMVRWIFLFMLVGSCVIVMLHGNSNLTASCALILVLCIAGFSILARHAEYLAGKYIQSKY
jgi:hypothetical protein